MMARAMVRRLCALAVLTVLIVAPPPLLAATCSVPRQVLAVLASITGSGAGGLCGTTSPVGSLVGFVVLSVWVYLVLVAALRAAALLGARARIAGSARLLVLTNRFLGGGWVRRLVDVTIGIGMVAASGSGYLSPPPGSGSSALASTGAPIQQVSLAEQVSELLGLDDSAGPITTARDDRQRRYVVQSGDTLALIAERELGDARRGPGPASSRCHAYPKGIQLRPNRSRRSPALDPNLADNFLHPEPDAAEGRHRAAVGLGRRVLPVGRDLRGAAAGPTAPSPRPPARAPRGRHLPLPIRNYQRHSAAHRQRAGAQPRGRFRYRGADVR